MVDPGEFADWALGVLNGDWRPGDDGALAEAVALARATVGEVPYEHPDRATYLDGLRLLLEARYERTEDAADLGEAVAVARDAVAASQSGGGVPSVLWYRLSHLLWLLHRHTGDSAPLSEAIGAARGGVAAAGDDDFTRTVHLNNLAMFLYGLFELTDDMPALREAVRLTEDVLSAASPESEERPMLLDNLRRVQFAVFSMTGDTTALARAVQAGREAVMTVLTGNPARAGQGRGLAGALAAVLRRMDDEARLAEVTRLAEDQVTGTDADEQAGPPGEYQKESLFLAGLAIAMVSLADHANDPDLLNEALEVSRQAVAAIGPGHRYRGLALNALWLAAWSIGGKTGDVAVLAEGVGAAREALALTPADDQDRADATHSLGTALRVLANWTGDDDALAEAVLLARAAVAITPVGDPDRGLYLDGLRNVLTQLCDRSGDTTALAEAVLVAREAVAITPRASPERADYLGGLSRALRGLSAQTGSTAMEAEAVLVAREAVLAAPDDSECLDCLGTALLATYEHGGDDRVLAEAVRLRRAALAAAAAVPVDRAKYLSHLGFALRVQFERGGDAAVLAEAVQVAGEAVATVPAGYPARAVYLTNWANALLVQYERTGELAVLARAVQAQRDAVTVTPAGHPDRSGYLSNLANGLRVLSARTEDMEPLAEAVRVGREAVAASRAADLDRVDCLANLAGILSVWSDRADDAEALAEAVRVARDAVAAASAGSMKHNTALSNLGNILRLRYDATGDPAVLAEAVGTARAAVAATPADQPARTGHLVNLAIALTRQSDHAHDPGALAEARACYAEAARNTSAPGLERILGHREAADLTIPAGGPPQDALAELEAAVALLPQVTARDLVQADQRHAVASLASLAGQVAAAAVAAGRPDRAVELLEQTRGILVADTLDALSSDLTRLRADAPGLAREFERLRSRIDSLNRSDGLNRPDGPGGTGDLASGRRAAYAAWDDLIARIRGARGFAGFLRPPDIRALARQAAAGPVVFPYASDTGCGALVLTDDLAAPVLAVTVDLTQAEAYRQVRRLMDALDGEPSADGGRAAPDVIHAVLAWMWDAVAGPVLDRLGYAAAPADGSAWPRVWWCPIGILAYLPWHAAGHHDDRPRTVMDRVISSYASTLRGMAYSRAQRPEPAGGAVLVVVASDAPDAPPLPGANREAQVITRLIPAATVLRHPTHDTVRAALPSCPVAHFACHGYADGANPADSQLILYDHRTDPLTVGEISALRLAGQLAYLSACNTAVTSLDLADEAVHIAGAFHLAGYRNVIGTLWPVGDASARLVAEGFYRTLTGDGTRPPDTSQACVALHAATRRLRDRVPGQPAHWAGYIHTGG